LACYFVVRRSQPHCGDAPSSRLAAGQNPQPRHLHLFMGWLLSVAGNPENQDCGCILEGSQTVLCVADGAGGLSGAAAAAKKAMEMVRQNGAGLHTAESASGLLGRMDSEIASDSTAGETTCALAVIADGKIFGASVGDSGVWLIPKSGTHIDLTVYQQRKPLIGTGAALPVPFSHPISDGFLLLGTDGLFKYTSAERILQTCREYPPETAVKQLIELVRYKSGALPDDVTVILTRLCEDAT